MRSSSIEVILDYVHRVEDHTSRTADGRQIFGYNRRIGCEPKLQLKAEFGVTRNSPTTFHGR